MTTVDPYAEHVVAEGFDAPRIQRELMTLLGAGELRVNVPAILARGRKA